MANTFSVEVVLPYPHKASMRIDDVDHFCKVIKHQAKTQNIEGGILIGYTLEEIIKIRDSLRDERSEPKSRRRSRRR